MTFTRLGDEYPAEARNLTDAEFRTHTEALTWSNWRLLDLHIPKEDVKRFAETGVPIARVTAGLVAKGWWRDDGAAWYIGLVHPEWQFSAFEVRADKSRSAARMRRVRRHKANDHSLCDSANCQDAAPQPPDVRANVHPNGDPNVHPDVRRTFGAQSNPIRTLRSVRCKHLSLPG
jgi:hypothetical protein